MKRIAALALVVFLAGVSAWGADLSLNVLGAYYFPSWSGYGASGFAPLEYSVLEGEDAVGAQERDVGSTWGAAEAKASLSLTEKMPFLVRDGALTAGNNLKGKASFEISPVSANLVGQVSLTPIAFLVFDAGAAFGTGWSALGFRGLGINPAGNVAEDIDLTPFGGAVWRVWGAGTFQFDLAAVKPGDWNHVVISANAKLEYEAYTGADEDEAWLYEADAGENFNGAKFYATYILGYQMPLTVNFVGLMVESDEWLGEVRDDSPMADDGWGSDFRTWQVGSLTNVKLGAKDSLLVIVQFKRAKDWTDATTLKRDFRTRVYDDAYWYFNRIALSYTHSF